MSELYVDLSDHEDDDTFTVIFQQSQKKFSEFINLRIESDILLKLGNHELLIGYLINNRMNNSKLVLIKNQKYKERLIDYLNTRDIQYDGVVENDFIESIKHSLNI